MMLKHMFVIWGSSVLRFRLFTKLIAIYFFCISVSGCAMLEINSAMSNYQKEAEKIALGDSKEKVLEILMPTQASLLARLKRPSECYKEGNNVIEIFYFRSGWISDGLITDDEFTPYVFTNGMLTSIGWVALGGAKTHGQVVPEMNIKQTTVVK